MTPSEELIRKAGAPLRHERRVEATIDAALEAASGKQGLAALLIAMDVHGVGGLCDCEGEATQRLLPHGVHRTLGSGRWHALDGGAYRAAAHEAIRRLVGEKLRWRTALVAVLDRSFILTPDAGIGREEIPVGDIIALGANARRFLRAFLARRIINLAPEGEVVNLPRPDMGAVMWDYTEEESSSVTELYDSLVDEGVFEAL